MTKAGFWKTDWFLGLVVALVFLFTGGTALISGLERTAYDWGVRGSSRTPSDKIAVIAIDEQSLANIGRWPWSREILAKMTDNLAAAKAKVIGNTVLFSEPQLDPGLAYVNKLLEIYAKLPSSGPGANSTPPDAAADWAQIGATLHEAEAALNTDRKLAESFSKAGNVLQPMLFTLGEPRGRPDKPLPDFVMRNALAGVSQGEDTPLLTRAVQYPIEAIGRAAAGLGHLNQNRDVDGAIRTEPLVVGYFDQYFPSLSLMIAAKSLNLGVADIKAPPGEGVRLGRLKITTDSTLEMNTYFYKDRDGKQAFPVDSFYDVYTGKIPIDKYRDKIVLIGATAAGLGDAPATPISPGMPPVLTLAHTVSSILQEHFFVRPSWAPWTELLVLVLVAGYLIGLLPRLSAGMGAMVTAGVAGALLTAHFALMVGQGTWLQLMQPLALLVVGHVLLVTKRFVVTESAKVKSDASSAESNRMLGIAYQQQGQLDLAWDKFRQVPMSDAVMENLYNLALDFERKRQFNKAESVFRHMHEFNPKFKDLDQKLSRARQLSETVILGARSSHPGGSLNLAAGEKPKFGRFEVQKELGQGAMGKVYLGKDPKIGREVAIKTMELQQEFEPDELADAKARFLREAETAGRLSHPNIVTIYDTGEEHDYCYIAMEVLKGGDLTPFVKPGSLLPLDRVVSIVARAADALGYAHKQGVVHRDVKPANMMYHAETDTLKLTDFGIARLTDSSKTKTGMVLGTPSYMSPEQLQGKKVDGRSDLFSLAVSLYQLVCGKLPFEGDSMAQLMYRIANEDAPDILQYNPSLPPSFVAFLDRALSKEADARYQAGEEFAAELRASFGGSPVPSGTGVDISL